MSLFLSWDILIYHTHPSYFPKREYRIIISILISLWNMIPTVVRVTWAGRLHARCAISDAVTTVEMTVFTKRDTFNFFKIQASSGEVIIFILYLQHLLTWSWSVGFQPVVNIVSIIKVAVMIDVSQFFVCR